MSNTTKDAEAELLVPPAKEKKVDTPIGEKNDAPAVTGTTVAVVSGPSQPDNVKTVTTVFIPEKEIETTPISQADILFELDNRGFRSMDEALRLIKRYDEAVKEARLAEERMAELTEEQKIIDARFIAREAGIVEQAKAMLAQRAEQDARLKQINERISLLSKLES